MLAIKAYKHISNSRNKTNNLSFTKQCNQEIESPTTLEQNEKGTKMDLVGVLKIKEFGCALPKHNYEIPRLIEMK